MDRIEGQHRYRRRANERLIGKCSTSSEMNSMSVWIGKFLPPFEVIQSFVTISSFEGRKQHPYEFTKITSTPL